MSKNSNIVDQVVTRLKEEEAADNLSSRVSILAISVICVAGGFYVYQLYIEKRLDYLSQTIPYVWQGRIADLETAVFGRDKNGNLKNPERNVDGTVKSESA